MQLTSRLNKIGRASGIIGGALGVIATIAVLTLLFYKGVRVTVLSSGERIEELFRMPLIQANDGLVSIIVFFSAMVIASVAAFVLAIKTTQANHRRYGMAMI